MNMRRLLGYSCRNRAIQYPIHVEALEKIGILHKRARASGFAGGLLITGFTGSGKSTVKKEYASRFPKQDEGEKTRIPVLCVDTPSTPTIKNLAEVMLVALGDPAFYRGTAEQKTQQIYRLLKLCKVELLIIDEFQHFFEHGRHDEAIRVTDWLKNILNTANIPVVLMGLPYCDLVLRLNVQLARRFSSRHFLRPFGFRTPEEVREFRGILAAIQEDLPIPSTSLSLPEMAMRFYYATYGLMDFIGKIIDGAVMLAHRHGHMRLDEELFAEAFEEEVWRDVPRELNPFVAKQEDLRLLNQVGEPFAMVESSPIFSSRGGWSSVRSK